MTLLEVVHAVAEAVGLSRPRREVSWAGESVVYTKPFQDVRSGNFLETEPIWFPFTGRLPIQALEDRDGFLHIRDGENDGWVLKADFILAGDASAYFSRGVRANPDDLWPLGMLAWLRLEAGECGKAIRGYDEYLRRDPESADMFHNRGVAYTRRRDYGRAIRDYDEATRLDPPAADAYFKQVVRREVTRGPDAVELYRAALKLQGHQCASSAYAVILGHLAAGQVGDGVAAQRFLTDSADKLDAAWPEPVVRFLRGELDEPAVFELAADDQRAETHWLLGMHSAIQGRPAEAQAHFLWVKDYGTPGSEISDMALAEYDRINAATPQAR